MPSSCHSDKLSTSSIFDQSNRDRLTRPGSEVVSESDGRLPSKSNVDQAHELDADKCFLQHASAIICLPESLIWPSFCTTRRRASLSLHLFAQAIFPSFDMDLLTKAWRQRTCELSPIGPASMSMSSTVLSGTLGWACLTHTSFKLRQAFLHRGKSSAVTGTQRLPLISCSLCPFTFVLHSVLKFPGFRLRGMASNPS